MREIKFIVWDKENKKMVSESNVEVTDYFLVLDLEGNLYDAAFDRVNEGTLNSNFEVMQYIGIKDKKDKRICEGSIVKIVTMDYNNKYVGNVFYADKNAMYMVATQPDGYVFGFDCIIESETEVIGNVAIKKDLKRLKE